MKETSKSTNFNKKVLERVKELTKQGKHVEASALFNKIFPDFNK
jgi:hypothetical protein